ncbi:GM15186 [Drosophila sechellia]|uniref:GM15186 n=1 Tax=Drosophila sechellia TaxID=7238 RepID=B4IBQ6_DROSE|nr:GM15186 [Drosophila sechellia]
MEEQSPPRDSLLFGPPRHQQMPKVNLFRVAAIPVDVQLQRIRILEKDAGHGHGAESPHRKINAHERPLADCLNRPIGIRLPRLQLQLKDNINVNVSGRRSCAAPVGIASDIYIAQNRRIEKTESPRRSLCSSRHKNEHGPTAVRGAT